METASPCGLVVNADDWGRNIDITDRIDDCLRRRSVSAVSAMVFMEDSARAADLANRDGIDAGLHLNLTAPFTARDCSKRLKDLQAKISGYLLSNPIARIFYHPGLKPAFEYVVAAQLEEYQRLYGQEAARIDGHHHQHLCANVVSQKLLPAGTLVRRNFSFLASEKSFLNRMYRRSIDRKLASRHRLVDYLFPLPPIEPVARLERIFSVARNSVVELETHPINPDEYRFLTAGGLQRLLGDLAIAPGFRAVLAEGKPRL